MLLLLLFGCRSHVWLLMMMKALSMLLLMFPLAVFSLVARGVGSGVLFNQKRFNSTVESTVGTPSELLFDFSVNYRSDLKPRRRFLCSQTVRYGTLLLSVPSLPTPRRDHNT